MDNEFFYLPYTQPNENSLVYNGLSEMRSIITENDTDLYLIINKSNRTFFIVGDTVFKYTQQLVKLKQVTLNQIREWHK